MIGLSASLWNPLIGGIVKENGPSIVESNLTFQYLPPDGPGPVAAATGTAASVFSGTLIGYNVGRIATRALVRQNLEKKVPMLKSVLTLSCVLSLLCASPLVGQSPHRESPGERHGADAVHFDPVVRDIEGWTVSIDPALVDGPHQEEGTKALAMLANHLQRIKILVPADRLEGLQAMEIWIEHAHPRLGAMQYHPDKGWLTARGHDPRLAKKVHITHAAELLSRHQMLKHPAVILHELSHAYHDQVLGFDEPRIIAAYKKAMKAGLYDEVLEYTGRKVRHYAANNPMEYFAEETEAYFYRNDFYPFVRAELKQHDPVLHDLLEDIWGPMK